MQAVKDATKYFPWGIIKVENGSFDGPGYENRYRKEDTRPLGHKLIVNRGTTECNSESFRRCRNRLPHIIKKVSEGLKQFSEMHQNQQAKKAEEEQVKNSTTETQETKETEIIEEFDVPEELPEEEKELLGDKVIEEKIEEKQDEEKKPDLSSFLQDMNAFSAEGDIKKVSDHLKNTFEQPETAKNIFSEMFSSGDKFGEAIKGFFDFVGNCKQNKDKIQQQCEEIKKQQEESQNLEEAPLISDVQEETSVEVELAPHDLEKIAYLKEMFPQYPENLMKDLVKKHPTTSLSDLIDLIVAEQFY